MVVGTGCPVHPLQDTTFLEAGEEVLPIHSLQPARSQLQTQLSGGSMSQTGEYNVDLVPQVTVGVLLHVHIRAIVAEIESDGSKARGADRLEQSGEETVQLRAPGVVRDECQFSEVCEPQILEEVGMIGCP